MRTRPRALALPASAGVRALARIPLSGFILTLTFICALAALPASAATLFNIVCPDSVPEGRAFFLRIDADPNCEKITIEWLGRELVMSGEVEDGRLRVETLLGTGMHERQTQSEFVLRVSISYRGEQWSEVRKIIRGPLAYPEQHLDVPRKYTELSDENLSRHRREKQLVTDAKYALSAKRLWAYPLLRPVPGKINSDFGLRRFFNGEAKSPHGGVDLKASAGSEIRACAGGRVILTGDHFFAGRSVYLDHGQGLVSMYFHLSRIDVAEGDLLNAGDPLGLIGSSGRVTGPHLHWGLSVHGQLVDPIPLLGD